MTTVFYCGDKNMCPKTVPCKLPNIHQVSLQVEDLCQFENCNDPLYQQYIDLMKYTNTQKLSMLYIRCSKRTVAMIDNYQEIWMWGDGINIGAGELKFMNVPFSLGKFVGKSYQQVAPGLDHNVSIDSKQKIYVWGSSKYCCHGQITDEVLYHPKKVSKVIFGPNSGKIYAQYVATSDNFTLLSVDNKLYTFGKERNGRLGQDQANIDYSDRAYLLDLHNIKVCGITAGLDHCMCWDSSGALYSWGSNQYGKAGHPIIKENQKRVYLKPERISCLSENIISAAAGYNHSIALTFKGAIYQWGALLYLKYDPDTNRPQKLQPQIIGSHRPTEDIHFLKISTFAYHNASIDQHGFLYTWGKNVDYCLGQNDHKDYLNPTLVEKLARHKTIEVGCGENFTVISCAKGDNQYFNKNIKEFQNKMVQSVKDRVQRSKIIQFKAINPNQPNQPARPQTAVSIGSTKKKHELTSIELRTTGRNFLNDFIKTNSNLVRDMAYQNQVESNIKSQPTKLYEIQNIKPFRDVKTTQPKYMTQTADFDFNGEWIVFDMATEYIRDKIPDQYQLEDAEGAVKQENFIHGLDKDLKQKTQRRNLILHGFKGVPIQSNFQEEIDLIYKEYKSTKSSTKSMHKPTTIREKVNSYTTLSHQKLPRQIQTVDSQESIGLQRVQSANPKISNFLQKIEPEEDEEIEIEISPQRKKRQVDPQQIYDRKKKSLQMKGKLRDYKIKQAQLKMQQNIEQKAANVYNSYVKRTVDYEKVVQEKKAIEKRQKQMVLNWIIYLNLESILQEFNIIRHVQKEEMRRLFIMNHRAKRIQRAYKKCRIRKLIEALPKNQKRMIRLLVFKLIVLVRIRKKGRATRQLKNFLIVQQLRKKVRFNLHTVITNIKHVQHFVQWMKKIHEHKIKQLSQVWDNLVLIKNSKIKEGKKLDLNSDYAQRMFQVISQRMESANLTVQEPKFIKFEDYRKLALVGGSDFEIILDDRKNDLECQYQQGLQATSFQTLLNEINKLNPVEKDRIRGYHRSSTSVIKPEHLALLQLDSPKNFEKINVEKNFSLLPFTEHSDYLQLQTQYLLRIDNVKKSESLFQQAIKIEKNVKFEIIQLIVNDNRKKYQKLLGNYIKEKNEFIKENRELIDLERAKLLLRTPLHKLQQIHRKENLQKNIRKKKRDKLNDLQVMDHLPFAELKPIIASRLPDVPEKPQLKFNLTQEIFKKYFNQYHQMIKQKLVDLETRSKFGYVKK